MGYLKIFADNAIVNIGDNCKINSNFTLGASGGHIFIGNNVMIWPNVVLRSSDHC